MRLLFASGCTRCGPAVVQTVTSLHLPESLLSRHLHRIVGSHTSACGHSKGKGVSPMSWMRSMSAIHRKSRQTASSERTAIFFVFTNRVSERSLRVVADSMSLASRPGFSIGTCQSRLLEAHCVAQSTMDYQFKPAMHRSRRWAQPPSLRQRLMSSMNRHRSNRRNQCCRSLRLAEQSGIGSTASRLIISFVRSLLARVSSPKGAAPACALQPAPPTSSRTAAGSLPCSDGGVLAQSEICLEDMDCRRR